MPDSAANSPKTDLQDLMDVMLSKSATEMHIFGPEIKPTADFSVPSHPFTNTWLQFRVDYLLTYIPNTAALLASGNPAIPIPEQQQFITANFLVRAVSILDDRLYQYQRNHGLQNNPNDSFFKRINSVSNSLAGLNRADLHDLRLLRNDLAHNFPGPNVTQSYPKWIGIVEIALVALGDLKKTYELQHGNSERKALSLINAADTDPQHADFVQDRDHYIATYNFNIVDDKNLLITYDWTFVHIRWDSQRDQILPGQ